MKQGFEGSDQDDKDPEGKGSRPQAGRRNYEGSPNALDGKAWAYHGSPVMEITEEEDRKYDDTLEKMERKIQPSQEEFYIMSHAFLR